VEYDLINSTVDRFANSSVKVVRTSVKLSEHEPPTISAIYTFRRT
jgi:hypothetical protein